jgi:hypothetical protein
MTVTKARNAPRQRRLQEKSGPLELPQSVCSPTADATTNAPIVADDLATMIPVRGPGLEVIETYLGHLIDRLLMEAGSDNAVMNASTPEPGTPIQASRPRS